MTLATIDIVVVVIYAIGIFALAQYVSREKDGHEKDTSDYFLASKSLPWWAIGASLIAANISAEQIVGMSGSGYAIGLAIASYEWMAALTLLIVGKWFLPIFLRNGIYTMPQFLEQRYGPRIRTLMAVFWLGLYVFVNLTSILWLGSIAVDQVAGMDQMLALVALGVFALAYQLYGGLKAVALTDIVQVTLLVLGGLLVTGITLSQIGGGAGVARRLRAARRAGAREVRHDPVARQSLLQGPAGPLRADRRHVDRQPQLLGLQPVHHPARAGGQGHPEAQKGVVFAAFLKLLMPVIIVLPGIAAVVLAPDLTRPDEAYPTMMALLPTGILGLVFAALVAAIVASTASKINSIATIFTLDFYAKFRGEQPRRGWRSDRKRMAQLVWSAASPPSSRSCIAILTARPLLGSFDQAFQYIQEFTGFFTPGHRGDLPARPVLEAGQRGRRDRRSGGLGPAFLDVLVRLDGERSGAVGAWLSQQHSVHEPDDVGVPRIVGHCGWPVAADPRVDCSRPDQRGGRQLPDQNRFNLAAFAVMAILRRALRNMVVNLAKEDFMRNRAAF